MNYLTLITFQRIIFSILFILSGMYLIIFLLKEIFMLFIPRKKQTQTIDMYQLLSNNIPHQPQITIRKENIQPEIIKENLQPELTIKKEKREQKYTDESPKVKKIIKIKKERKSRKRKE